MPIPKVEWFLVYIGTITFSNQDALQSYGEENVRNLNEASKKYNPKGLF